MLVHFHIHSVCNMLAIDFHMEMFEDLGLELYGCCMHCHHLKSKTIIIINDYYYANMPMQYSAIFKGCENDFFR